MRKSSFQIWYWRKILSSKVLKIYMSYSAKHLSFQESLWLKEWKFQAVVKNSDVCCSCLLCGSDAVRSRLPPMVPRATPSPAALAVPLHPMEAGRHRHAADLARTWPCQPRRGSSVSEQLEVCSVPQSRSPWSQPQGSAAAGTHSTGKGAVRSQTALQAAHHMKAHLLLTKAKGQPSGRTASS